MKEAAYKRHLICLICFICLAAGAAVPGYAGEISDNIDWQWGGHLKTFASVTWFEDTSLYYTFEKDPWYDGYTDFRLKNKTFYGETIHFDIHYEVVLSGGDTRKAEHRLVDIYPDLPARNIITSGSINDDLRFFNLFHVIEDEDDYILHQRLDRFAMTFQPEWGTLVIGRQVVTWGNGLIFNPMDLFNPFSPADTVRDYKIGDDMMSVMFNADRIGEFQFLYVPRRDLETGDVDWSRSSLAGKLHFFAGTTEFDFMAATHYEDEVVGIGSEGYLYDAAWRIDVLWTFVDEKSDEDDFLSFVANMDYSWIWWNKNFYGLVEFYFSGLGSDDYSRLYSDPDIYERVARGEIFTSGRSYLACEIQCELHPLVNAYFSVINNLEDPSGIVLPRFSWDARQNISVVSGAALHYGGTNTEFGGMDIPSTDLRFEPHDNVYVLLTYYF